MTKNYWEERYQNNETGWDVGSITTPLKEYIDQIDDKNIKILLPGAGNGYEFEYLYNQGFTNVYVVDIAHTPLENIKKRMPHIKEEFLLHADFFHINDTFDLIVEQTFFCAINPDLRKEYVEKAHQLLNAKGKIAGLLFDFPLTTEGPPFGGCKEEYVGLFSDKFTIKTLEKAHNSIKPRADKEFFIIFEKK